jgi:hypothetical protein
MGHSTGGHMADIGGRMQSPVRVDLVIILAILW